MTASHDTVRHPHHEGTSSRASEQRKYDSLRKRINALHSMLIPEDRLLRLTYRVEGTKLMAFGLSIKSVAEIGHIVSSDLKQMSHFEMQREVENLLKKKRYSFIEYELDMKRFLQMRRSKPQCADVFAACNSELFPDRERGMSVELYSLKYQLKEDEVRRMLDEAEKTLLVKVD